MAFLRMFLVCVVVLAMGAESSRLTRRLPHLQAASLALTEAVSGTLDRAKEDYCAEEECQEGFLRGIGNPLCRRHRGFFNGNQTDEQIGAEIAETDVSLKVWSCVLEFVLVETEDEGESEEIYTTASIAAQMDTLRAMMKNMGLPQAFSDAPCSLILLQAFKRHAETLTDHVNVMRSSIN
ncbi:hypothetical protein Bbelb_320840 [Branchiostoma belcheri]|nr:hypothetical protein Bbelb_320840 [Branchiostoma belcheri]